MFDSPLTSCCNCRIIFFVLKRNVITHIHPIDAYTKSQLLGLIGSDKDDPINGVNPKLANDKKKKKISSFINQFG